MPREIIWIYQRGEKVQLERKIYSGTEVRAELL